MPSEGSIGRRTPFQLQFPAGISWGSFLEDAPCPHGEVASVIQLALFWSSPRVNTRAFSALLVSLVG